MGAFAEQTPAKVFPPVRDFGTRCFGVLGDIGFCRSSESGPQGKGTGEIRAIARTSHRNLTTLAKTKIEYQYALCRGRAAGRSDQARYFEVSAYERARTTETKAPAALRISQRRITALDAADAIRASFSVTLGRHGRPALIAWYDRNRD